MTSLHLIPPFKVKAQYSWSGETKNDLGFLENDIIEVSKIKGNWFYGTLLRNSKKYGFFPNNFVTVIEERYNGFRQESAPNLTTSHAASMDLGNTTVSKIPPIPSRGKGGSRSQGHRSAQTRSSQQYDTGSPKRSSGTGGGGARTSHPAPRPLHSSSTSSLLATRQQEYVEKYSKRKSLTVPEQLHYMPDKTGRNDLPPLPPMPSPQLKEYAMQKSRSSNDLSLSPLSASKRYSYELSSNNNSPRDSLGFLTTSRYMDDSITSSENSLAFMSDFSATSAGSFARHRFAKSFNDSLQRSQLILEESSSNGHFESKSQSKFGNAFKRFLAPTETPRGKNAYPKLPDLTNLHLSSSNEGNSWVEAKAQLHRAQTINQRERHERQILALEEDRYLVLHPQEYVNDKLNTNEVKHGRQPGLVDIELARLDVDFLRDCALRRAKRGLFKSVESFAKYAFSKSFKTQMEQLLGIFIFVTEEYDLVDDNGQTDFNAPPPKIDKVLQRSWCTPYELAWIFKLLANAINIPCELVIGFLKTPGSDNQKFRYNHCWLSVLISQEWRFVDVILGNKTNPIHEYSKNKIARQGEFFYFMAQPLHFIYTHVPKLYQEQHIIPSIEHTVALSLPLVFPSFFKNEIILNKFSNGLSTLYDTQIYECTLALPNDVEVFSSVIVDGDEETSRNEQDLSLVQVRHKKKERLAVVKAILPPFASRGTLHIHSGIKGTQTTVENVHPLSLEIPITQRGLAKDYEFVTRVPSKNVQKVEMYIKQPQNKFLFPQQEYQFQIIQAPCDGVVHGSMGYSKSINQSLAMQSPSGKIVPMKKVDPNCEYGTWELLLQTVEPGVWSGLVTADTGVGWCTFARWTCIRD
ncbi:LAMI_0E03026g1_1 [Lachancea mirantina]|uniref:LAMI_0E03026g1_1 n=1 Tax=Lachancea mirantina TaxID=1230905 RepID=A0A1G4JJG1_9SACH|nr:LAMI_0E03026g1_1 [Lachancea mirantina]